MPKPLVPIEELLAMYEDFGMSTSEIANALGCSQSGVSMRLRRHGAKMRPRYGHGSRKGGKPGHRNLGPKILELRARGLMSQEIASELECSIGNVYYHFKKNGVKTHERYVPK